MVDFWKNDPVHEFWKNDEVVPAPQPSQRPSAEEMQPPPKQWQPTRGASLATKKMDVSAADIPGAPSLLAATNLGGSPEDLVELQKHLNGVAEQEKSVPETEYSKAKKEGKGFFAAARQDLPGFLGETLHEAKQGILPMAAAIPATVAGATLGGTTAGPFGVVLGGGAGSAIPFAATSYADSLINETRKLGGKLEDAKQFNDVYLKNKQAIDEAAARDAKISGGVAAIFGMLPGGGGLKGMIGRLGVYGAAPVAGENVKRKLAGEEYQTPEEMAETAAKSAIMGAPFELAAAARAPKPEPKIAQPPHFDYEGEVVQPAPQLPPSSGPAPAEPLALPAPKSEAPAVVSPTPNGPVEARGPVTPPAPVAPPSEAAADLVRQGVSPLEAIKEVGEGAPIVNPLEQPQGKPPQAQEPPAQPVSLKDQINDIVVTEVTDRANALVQQGIPHDKAVDQAGTEVAKKYEDPKAVQNLVDTLSSQRPAGPVVEPAPFNAPIVAEPARPASGLGKVEYATVKDEPKLDVVEGHKYISMPAPQFMTGIGEAPIFFHRDQKDDQRLLPDNGSIKIRLDPSKLQNGGAKIEAKAKAKDAIQQIIVGPTAFKPETGKGEQKKKAVEANSQLQAVLDDLSKNHGVNITYVGQDKTVRRRAGVGDTLVSLAISMGGIKDVGGDLRAMDLNKVPGVINNKTGVPFDRFADAAIGNTDWYPQFKGEIANSKTTNQATPDMYRQVMEDLGARKSFKEPTNKRVDPTELDYYIGNQKAEGAARQAITEMAQKYNLPTHDDIINYAARVMQVNKGISPYDAYLTAHVREANKLGLSDTDLREFIGEDLYNAIARPAQEARAGSGTVGPEGAKPANAPAPEGKRPTEPPVSQTSVSAVKPAEVKAEPKAEPGAEGKPQLVIPGADKITEGQLAQRLANKPMQAKVDQKEPDGLFGSGRNQLDLLSAPSEPKAPIAPEIKIEQPKPVLVWVEPPKPATKNFGPFKAGVKFSKSKNFPADLAGVAEGWAKMLGIDAPIHMTTFDDAKAANFKDDAAPITKYGRNKGAYGTAVYLGRPGSQHFAILIKETGNRVKDLETVAHELGHVLQNYAFNSADPAVKKKLEDAHRNWAKEFRDKTVGDVLRSRKAPQTAKMMLENGKADLTPIKDLRPKDRSYALGFSEYFADQVARWAMTSEKPLGVVEKFFKGVGAGLRKLYHGAKREGAFPNETFKDFIESVTGNVEVKQAEGGGGNNEGALFERDILNPDEEPKLPEPKVEIHRNGVLAQGLVDKFSDLYKIQKAYEKLRGAQLPESMDAYLAQELFNNRVISRQEAVWKDEVQPLLNEMKKQNITPEEFAAFLYARHASERNEVMRQRDPKRFGADGGSGMTNQTAKDILNKFRTPVEVRVNGVNTRLPSQYDIMERLDRDFVRPMIRKDLSQRLQFGTLTKEQYDQYTRPRTEGGYNHYVPLRGSAEADAAADENIVRSSRNFGVSGKDFKIAFGRGSEAFNPLFNVIQQRMEGIVRQEKNKVDTAIAKFVEAHPDNKMARLITNANAPTIKYLAADGTVHERVAFTPQAMETILPFKANGEQKYLQFDKENPATVRLVTALKGMPANAVNPVMNGIFQFSRTFSRLNTSLVPDFFLTNFPRDVQDALMTMYGTKEGMAGQFMQDLGGAAKTIFQIEGGLPTTEADRILHQEWVDSGGKLNYGGFRDIATVAKDIEKSMKDAFDSDAGLKDKALRAGDKALDTTVAALSKVNDVFEDAVRFAVYRAARKNGYSKERAASLSLNSTVNFQTKGAWMPQLNALKPFLSASVGSLRSVYRLAQNSPKRFGQFLTAMILGSIANSLLGVWMSDTDDVDPNKSKYFTNVRGYERQKNFILPYQFADGHYAKIPTGFFYGPAVVLGDNIAGMMTGHMTPEEAATNVALSIYDYANPLGSGTWASQLLFTPIAPFVQHAVNKDWLGRPIHPEETNRTKGIPASEQYSKGSPDWAVSTAHFLNSATGGDQFKKGWLDVYPDTLKHYFTFFTGGLGTFTGRSVNAVNNYFENTPTPTEEIPYMRRLMTNAKGIDESKYYDVKGKITEKQNVFNSAMEQYKSDQNPKAYEKVIESAQELNIRKGKDGKLDNTKSVPTIFKKVEDINTTLKEAIEITRADKTMAPLEKQSRVADYEKQIKDNMLTMRKFMYEREPSQPSPLMKMMGK